MSRTQSPTGGRGIDSRRGNLTDRSDSIRQIRVSPAGAMVAALPSTAPHASLSHRAPHRAGRGLRNATGHERFILPLSQEAVAGGHQPAKHPREHARGTADGMPPEESRVNPPPLAGQRPEDRDDTHTERNEPHEFHTRTAPRRRAGGRERERDDDERAMTGARRSAGPARRN